MKKAVLFFFLLISLNGFSQTVKEYIAILTNTTPAQYTCGQLVVGQRYIIQTLNGTDDFSNVGSQNTLGGEFIATGTTPNNWTSNSLLITPLPPTAHVIKNTIGDIVLKRDDPGIYEAYLPGAFPKYRTVIMLGSVAQSNAFFGANWAQSGDPDDDGFSDWVDFGTLDNMGSGADAQFYYTPLIIQIYE